MSKQNEKEINNSQASIKESKVSNLLKDGMEQHKIKKKFYCLYKNGTKYIVKKKEKDVLSELKYRNINKDIIEKKIHNNFILKYKKFSNNYNSIIAHRLVNNIDSHIVALFKDYLIYGDIYEFLTKYYNERSSLYLLNEILNYYKERNILFPKFSSLPEGIYMLRNIQQKQRILDNQEDNLRKKNKENNIYKNEDENVLTSKVIDSILNQTDTSEARNCFGIEKNNIEDSENNDINLLIENINKIEDINNKNQIFQKKIIRIIKNNKDEKENDIFRMCEYINKNKLNLHLQKNIILKDLEQNINNDFDNMKYIGNKKISNMSPYEKKKNNKIIYSIEKKNYLTQFNSSNINNNSCSRNVQTLNNNSYNHKKMNTIGGNKIKYRKKILFPISKEDISDKNSNNSFFNSNSPYITKKPIRQTTSYKKKNAYSYLYNKINLKKNNNNSNNFNYSPYDNNFNADKNNNNIDNNKNIENILYNKKINTINNDIEKNSINNSKTIKRVKKYIINKSNNMNTINTINDQNINKNIKIEDQNKKLTISSYGNSPLKTVDVNDSKKYNYKFKNIAKMIKRKYIKDGNNLYTPNNLYKNNNYHSYKKIIGTPLKIKKFLIKNEENITRENNNTNNINSSNNIISNSKTINNQKNIYISNNITNNNYYTIEHTTPRRKSNYSINRYSNLDSSNNKIIHKVLTLKTLSKNENKTLPFIKFNNNTINNNNYNNRDNSTNNMKRDVISPYKTNLINNTTLKSLNRDYLKHLLNKFDSKPNSKEKIDYKNKLNINDNNNQLNNNYFKTINIKNNGKNENKIREKRTYLILRDVKNPNYRDLKRNLDLNYINRKEIDKKINYSYNNNKLQYNIPNSTKNTRINNGKLLNNIDN